MPIIRFIDSAGVVRTVEARVGISLMEAARASGVPGIVADCGGTCSCATCHVYVDPDWVGRVGAASEIEQGMLEFAVVPKPNSRLSCQIRVTDALNGLVVHVPASQY